ncbi:hypothetical protein V5O48_017181, partial [Marasmius crinis-equi]
MTFDQRENTFKSPAQWIPTRSFEEMDGICGRGAPLSLRRQVGRCSDENFKWIVEFKFVGQEEEEKVEFEEMVMR